MADEKILKNKTKILDGTNKLDMGVVLFSENSVWVYKNIFIISGSFFLLLKY